MMSPAAGTDETSLKDQDFLDPRGLSEKIPNKPRSVLSTNTRICWSSNNKPQPEETCYSTTS